MNRRSFLFSSAGAAAISVAPRLAFAQTATPGTEPYPTLDIIVDDAGYTLPATIPAGRTLVTVSNKATTPTHNALGLLPANVTREVLEADIAKLSDPVQGVDYTPDWFWKATWVGLPDWPTPGAAVSGVVDLRPGLAIIVNPIGAQKPSVADVAGSWPASPEPAADGMVELIEMTIKLPASGFKAGKQRIKVTNKGAMEHEFALLPLPAGVTKEQVVSVFSAMFGGGTPTPDLPNVEFAPAGGCGILSEGGSTWVDLDLQPGHYAAFCALPDQSTGMPHLFMGMIETFDVG